jgi:hypothetical protein
LVFVEGALEILAAICAPPLLTNLPFSLRPVPLFLERLFCDARKIVMVADVDAESICNKEQGSDEE